MTSMQDKVLADLEALGPEFGVECIATMKWANTGTIQYVDGYVMVLEFTFEFNSGYGTDGPRATFEGVPNPERADEPARAMGANWWYLHLPEVPKFIKEVRNILARHKIDKENEWLTAQAAR